MSQCGQEGLLISQSQRPRHFLKEFIFIAIAALVLALALEAHAAVEVLRMTSEDSSVPIYRALGSPFSSGRIAKSRLMSTIGRTSLEPWLRVRSNSDNGKSPNHEGWIRSEAALVEWDISTFVEINKTAPVRALRMKSDMPTKSLPAKTVVRCLSHTEGWLLVSYGGFTGWIESTYANIYGSGWGKAYFPKTAKIYKAASVGSKSVSSIRSGTFARIRGAQGQFFWVETSDRVIGFVPAKNVISRLDFSDEVFIEKSWVAKKTTLALEKLKGFRSALPYAYINTDRVAAVDAPANDGKVITQLQRGQKVGVLADHRVIWAESSAEGHGQVWWPTNDKESHSADMVIRERWTLAELKKRGIYDVTKRKGSKEVQFASARGLFRSLDGKLWDEVPFFQGQNYPLAFESSGALLVGPYRSKDLGESFEPYFKSESILTALQGNRYKFQARKIPKSLRITEIKSFKNTGELRLRIETDRRQSQWISSYDDGKSWSLK
jgi:hypothetical protein